MFSFKTAIDRLDQNEERFDTAMECYLATILAMQEHAVDVTPELTRDYQHALRTIHRDIFGSRSIEALASSRAMLTRALEDYCAKTRSCLEKREDDLRSMIGELALAAETMSSHNSSHSTRLKEFTEKLQVTARATDLSQMKRDLTKHVSELRSTSHSIWMDNVGSTSAIQGKLADFQERLEIAEKRAATDALTGLFSRGEGEFRLRRCIAEGRIVSILLIDLNGFKQINDRWGHLCGDQVLKVFSRNLEQLVRPSDTVCRWGGDEFLVFSQQDDVIEQKRAEKLRDMLHSQYKVVALGKIFEVPVSASVGVAQARSGESVDDLLSRADTDMYQQKGTQEFDACGDSLHRRSLPDRLTHRKNAADKLKTSHSC